MENIKFDSKKINRFVVYALCFYILNKRLIDWFTFDITKFLYYPIIAAGALLGFISLMSSRKHRAIPIVFAIYSTIVVINGLAFRNTELLIEGIKTYITFLFPFFALVYFLDREEDYSKLFKGIAYWGAITSYLALHEYLEGESILPGFDGIIYSFETGDTVYRATVFIGSPMILGIALGIAMIISFYYLHTERKLKYLFLIVMQMIGMLSTGSRAPLLLTGLGIGVLYFMFFRQGTLPRKYVIAAVSLVLVVVIILALFVIFPDLSTGNEKLDFLIYRITSSFNFSTEWGNTARLKIWDYYIHQFLERPIFGYGVASTSYEPASNEHKRINIGHLWFIVAESGVLTRLVETGIIGAAAYYSFVFLCIRRWMGKVLRYPHKIKNESILFAIVAIFVLLLAEDVILQISLDIFCNYFLCLVLAFGLTYTSKISKFNVKEFLENSINGKRNPVFLSSEKQSPLSQRMIHKRRLPKDRNNES